MLKRGEGSPAAVLAKTNEILKDGTLELDFGINDRNIGKVQSNVLINSKSSNKQLSVAASMNNGEKRTTFDMYVDPDCVALRSNPISKNVYYGLTFDTFPEDLRNSGFGKMLTEDQMLQCDNIVDALDESINQTMDYQQLLEPYIELLLRYTDTLEPETGSEILSLDGKQCHCDTLTFQLEQSELAELIKDLVNQMEQDEHLRALIATAAIGDGLDFTTLRERLVDLNCSIDMKGDLCFYVYHSQLAAIMFDVEYAHRDTKNDAGLNIMLSFGKKPGQSDILCDIDIREGEAFTELSITSSVENKASGYLNILSFQKGADTGFIINNYWDRRNGDWSIRIKSNLSGIHHEYDISANLIETNSGFVLSAYDIHSLFDLGETDFEPYESCINLRVMSGATIRKPKYTNLDKISVRNIMDIVNSLRDEDLHPF